SLDCIDEFLAGGVDVNSLNNGKKTRYVLAFVAALGRVELVQALVERGLHLDHTSAEWIQVVNEVVIHDMADVLRYLFAVGADRDATFEVSSDESARLLLLAALFGSTECL